MRPTFLECDLQSDVRKKDEAEQADLHVLWQRGVRRLLQKYRACDVTLRDNSSQSKIWAIIKRKLLSPTKKNCYFVQYTYKSDYDDYDLRG